MRKIPNINTHIFKQPDLPWSLISDEAQAMLDNYELLGVALTGIERSSMIAYVDAEVASSNHTAKDYETIYSLAGVNALVDYIGGKTATAINAPTHDINGYTLDGSTQYIDTEYNPTDDGTNFILDDAFIGVFVKSVVDGSLSQYVIGSAGGTTNSVIRHTNSVGIQSSINTNANTNSLSEDMANNTHYLASRVLSTVAKLFKTGVEADSRTTNSSVILAADSWVGRLSGVYFDGVISAVSLGGSIGFNKSEHNTNLRALLTGLGVSL